MDYLTGFKNLLTTSDGHPNRLPFRGVLSLIDTASDKGAVGSKGRKILLTKTAAKTALSSLLGMGLNYNGSFDGHDARLKIGVLTQAELKGQELIVSGHIYARDFPEAAREIGTPAKPLGMSYEVVDVLVEDLTASVWKLKRVTFVGAAVLRRDMVAYQSTRIWLQCGADDPRISASADYSSSDRRKRPEQQRKRPWGSFAIGMAFLACGVALCMYGHEWIGVACTVIANVIAAMMLARRSL